jgi:hypothetical protein
MTNSEDPVRMICSEEFAELCALSTAGALTEEENARLQRHLAACGTCRGLLANYRALVVDGAAKMAGASGVSWEDFSQTWDEPAARSRLLGQLQALSAGTRAGLQTVTAVPRKWLTILTRRVAPALAVAAAVIVAGFFVSYHMPQKKPTATAQQAIAQADASLRRELAQIEAQRNALKAQLASDSRVLSDVTERFSRQERQLADSRNSNASLGAQLQTLAGVNRQQSEAVGSLSAQRDALQHRLDDTERSLQEMRDELNRRQEDQDKAVHRAASLETRIDELSSQLREKDLTVEQQREYLAFDRDIRELMGTRQLYIADVFDVDHNGKKRAPFGRVFYTKGKSLIFYAFDLDQPTGYRNAATFQVWGSPSEDQSKAVSLGVFYMDSEVNRRWVFKTDDPEVLAQINAVFVTVEPNAKTKVPTGKPILYAYLRSAPTNHP